MKTVITHIAITVKDMKESLRFYHDTLGFDEIFDLSNPETGKPWIVYIKVAPGQFLELFYGGTVQNPFKDENIGFSHMCFQVDDVNEIAKRITDAGYELTVPPCKGCDNNWQTWVRDPNGIRIELMAVSPDSPHAAHM